ncbi:hypothetical protein PTKIN_Ptkin14bG0227900 [Pterospermum kingtungense]
MSAHPKTNSREEVQTAAYGMNLFYCDLRGKLSEDIFNLSNIKYLTLDGNPSLTVQFPKSNWSNPLESLSASMTSVSAELPESIGNLKSLQSLYLVECNLSGSIPRFLSLSDNNMSGEISDICNMKSLEILDLSHNNFSGIIQRCIGSFSQSLSLLNLKMNNFHGIIPSIFAEGLSELQVLVLHSNKFQGSIRASKNPQPLPKLRIIDLSRNNFVGPLPTNYIKNFKGMMNLDEGRAARCMEERYYSYD